MKLLLAVDSMTTLDILLDEMMTRSWPGGTEARVLSIVEDGEVPLETWREEGYGVAAVRQEMRRRGEQITALAVERLRELGIPAEVVIMRGNPDFHISFVASAVVVSAAIAPPSFSHRSSIFFFRRFLGSGIVVSSLLCFAFQVYAGCQTRLNIRPVGSYYRC